MSSSIKKITHNGLSWLALLALGGWTMSAQAQFNHTADVNIDNQLCVGSTCAGTPTGTVELQSTAPLINMQDTSASAFDYDITVNTNDFAIRYRPDAGAAESVIFIEDSGAPNSLHIDPDGQIGFGTNDPQTSLHVFDAGFPALTLQGSGTGSTNILTNYFEGGFVLFVDPDGFGGVNPTAPFVAVNTAPDGAIFIGDTGTGFGTSSPTAAMHLFRDDGAAQFYVEDTLADAMPHTLFKIASAGSNTKFEIDNTTAGQSWAFTNSGADFRISRQGSGVVEFLVANNGNATLAGALTQNSDVNAKQAIVPVDSRQILDKVVSLPISQWQYKDEAGVNHIGPMAQDFHAAFALGATDTGIATIDTAGVALAAIQALANENHELRDRLARIEQQQAEELAELRSMLIDLQMAQGGQPVLTASH